MSEQINDGGPAFPAPISAENWLIGMTLRDYFAAKASEEDVQFHIRHHFNNERDMKLFPNEGTGIRNRAREQARYQYADAMLRAREAKP